MQFEPDKLELFDTVTQLFACVCLARVDVDEPSQIRMRRQCFGKLLRAPRLRLQMKNDPARHVIRGKIGCERLRGYFRISRYIR